MLAFLKVIIYNPLLNLLAVLISIVPRGDVGLAIILLTLLVKVILYPLTKKALNSQVKMNVLAPELARIKASGKSKEEQARETFELYKKHNANPFSGCLIQIPIIIIIISLYYIVAQGLEFAPGNLYSFVRPPEELNMHFLGLIDIGKKSFILAALAGLSQYFQALYM